MYMMNVNYSGQLRLIGGQAVYNNYAMTIAAVFATNVDDYKLIDSNDKQTR